MARRAPAQRVPPHRLILSRFPNCVDERSHELSEVLLARTGFDGTLQLRDLIWSDRRPAPWCTVITTGMTHDVHRGRGDRSEACGGAGGAPRRASRIAMDLAESGITEYPHYVRVDFVSCNALELSEIYRRFADFCIDRQVSRALLNAGDDDPGGHRRLRDAIGAMRRAAAIPPDFKLALVPSTPPIEAFYREAQQALRAGGVNAWVFDSVVEAVAWLEGRLPCGRMAS